MNLKNKILLIFVQTYRKWEDVPCLEMSPYKDREGKESPDVELSRDKDKKNAYIKNDMQLQNHTLFFIHKNKLLPSANSILSRSPTAYNNTAFLDKLTCTDYVDFGNC